MNAKEIAELVKNQKEYNDLHNEGQDGYNPYDEAIRLALLQPVPAIWTKDETIAKREAWNASIKALNGKKITYSELAVLEKSHGHTLATLKSEIKKHNL